MTNVDHIEQRARDHAANDLDIKVQSVELWICALCLTGAGGECHVPGCAFWCHDAPTGDTLRVLRGAAERTVQ